MNSSRSSSNLHWQLFEFKLPLKNPLQMLGNKLVSREGLILRLKSDSGNFGEGEISPLPGLHRETLVEAKNQLVHYLNYIYEPKESLHPSVSFALDMAISTFHLEYQQPSPLAVNGLAVGTGNELNAECESLLKAGFLSVKLKVGRLNIQQDITRVKMCRKILGDQIALRLDANRAWEFNDAKNFAEAIEDCQIEFCEEPLKDDSRLLELFKQTGLPIALDETLWNKIEVDASQMSFASALILKPGAIGALKQVKQWIDESKVKNALAPKIIFSSSFESGLALNWIAFMASNLFQIESSCGLDTFKWFLHDLIKPAFSLNQGQYHFPKSWPIADDSRLHLISAGEVKNTHLLKQFSSKFQ